MLTEDQVSEEEKQKSKMVVVAAIAEQEKSYYCQRCLNHGELKPRKGHKPECGYLKCPCAECNMVERRRQLNNALTRQKIQCPTSVITRNGKRVRDPHCARCSAHGVMVPLRGHKRTMCQFLACDCALCRLVEHRRELMAAQIKLRRSQQKSRAGEDHKPRKSRRVTHKEIVMTAMSVCVGAGNGANSPSLSSTDTMSPSPSLSPPVSPGPPVISTTTTVPPVSPVWAPIALPPPFPYYPTPTTVTQQLHLPASVLAPPTTTPFLLPFVLQQLHQFQQHHQQTPPILLVEQFLSSLLRTLPTPPM